MAEAEKEYSTDTPVPVEQTKGKEYTTDTPIPIEKESSDKKEDDKK